MTENERREAEIRSIMKMAGVIVKAEKPAKKEPAKKEKKAEK